MTVPRIILQSKKNMLVKMATFICYHNFTQRQNETATTNQLEEADAQGYEWEGSKAAGKPFQPRTTKFRHQYGQIMNCSDFAYEAAAYLELETIQ